MAMTTGARRGELLKLRWCDVDIKDSVAYLGDTKNGDDRELHFAPIVMDELKRFQEVGNGLIFPSAEKPTQAMDIRKAWEKALRLAKIPAKDILNPDGISSWKNSPSIAYATAFVLPCPILAGSLVK